MPVKTNEETRRLGLHFVGPLTGHKGDINRIAWSPDGSKLASSSYDDTIRVWDIRTRSELRILEALRRTSAEDKEKRALPNPTYDATWSPDGKTLVTCSEDGFITAWELATQKQLWQFDLDEIGAGELDYLPSGELIAAACSDGIVRLLAAKTGEVKYELKYHGKAVPTVAWSPDGRFLASGSFDRTICIWDRLHEEVWLKFEGHDDYVWSLAWSPSGNSLASASSDDTIRIWDPKTSKQIAILEGHTSPVKEVTYSFDGRFLASQSSEDVRIWRTDSYQLVASLQASNSYGTFVGLEFHPLELTLATSSRFDIGIFNLNDELLLGQSKSSESTHYSNAKVVLVGDSGVGKSGLGLVLTGEPWTETGSTHGRRVWVLDTHEVVTENGLKETRETLLWDLAGQPDYRLIHQLHLTEVAVALVVFDSRSQTDPFAGVRHWDRALRQAQRVQSGSLPPTQKYLVAARVDVGRIGASIERIEALR